MAKPNRQPITPLEPLSRSLMAEEMDPYKPMNSSVRHSPISRVTPSSARNFSNLPRPVSSLHTDVKNSPGSASYSRTRLGSRPVEHASSSGTRSNNIKDAPSKDRLIFGPSSRSNYKGETSASTARRIPPGSLVLALSSPSRTDKVKSSRLQPSPKKSSAPASSRRGQRGNLPFSLSSPNINNLSITNENMPPVPFAPKSELHERILRGSTVNNNCYPHPLYSNPTVASSPLTASASSTDISQPRSRNQREAEREISRIPSPTSGSRSRPFSRRHLITPVRKVIEKGEESQARRHIPVAWRLHQIHPGMESPPGPDQNQIQVPVVTPEPQLKAASLPKSRTFGVFATLKNSSSIQWLNSNRSATNPNRATEPIISTTKYSPMPEFTTNTLQIHTAQPSAYWCGRFQAVCDKYQTDDFNICVSSPLLYPNGGHFERENPAPPYKPGDEAIPETSPSLKCDSPALLLDKCRKKTPAKPSKTVLKFSTASTSLEDFDKRALKVMVILASLCCTGPAKKSFREWQVQYATAIKNKALLPKNDPDDRGFFGRVGRVISDGVTGNKNGTNGRGTGMGKRSAFGLRRSGRSAAGDN